MRRLALTLLLAQGCGRPATFIEVKQNVFGKSCVFSSCHKSSVLAGGLSLEGDEAFDHLVGKPAVGAPSKVRVQPGKPEESYLIEKLTQDQPAAGARMPPGATVSDEQLELLRSWIANGAKRD